MRALVTGGLGFIGSHLAAALADWEAVTIVDDLSTGRQEHRAVLPPNVEVVIGDLRMADPALFQGVDAVFHIGAQVQISRSIEDPVHDAAVNVLGSLHVLEQSRRHDVGAVVLSSSSAVYGASEIGIVDEAHPKEPLHPYGVGKLAMDHYGRVFADIYGLPTVMLRYANVYGPRQSATSEYAGVIAKFVDRARERKPLIVHGEGEQQRDFIHVSDVVRANLAAAAVAHSVRGRSYGIGTGIGTSVLELANQIVKLFGEGRIEHGPRRPADPLMSLTNPAAARAALGWEAKVGLAEGLKDLVAWAKGEQHETSDRTV